jgi:hypothetical protein
LTREPDASQQSCSQGNNYKAPSITSNLRRKEKKKKKRKENKRKRDSLKERKKENKRKVK